MWHVVAQVTDPIDGGGRVPAVQARDAAPLPYLVLSCSRYAASLPPSPSLFCPPVPPSLSLPPCRTLLSQHVPVKNVINCVGVGGTRGYEGGAEGHEAVPSCKSDTRRDTAAVRARATGCLLRDAATLPCTHTWYIELEAGPVLISAMCSI